jgi:hypothetical protein
MTIAEKEELRLKFRIAAFLMIAVELMMGFVLAYLSKDISGFSTLVLGLNTPITGLLVADYATTPKGSS